MGLNYRKQYGGSSKKLKIELLYDPAILLLGIYFTSLTQSCLTLCNPMDCSTPDFPVHHQIPEPTQTHVHEVSDAIQSSHPLSSPSPPAFNLSKHLGLFQGVSSSHQVAELLELQVQFRIDWLDLLAVQGTLKSLLQHHSSKASILQPSALYSNPHIHT